MNDQRWRGWATNLVVALVYGAVGYGTLALGEVGGVELRRVVWLPVGIALAVGLAVPFRIWPGVAVGGAMATFLDGGNALLVAATAVANGMEVGVSVHLLRTRGFETGLYRLKDVLRLVVVASGMIASLAAVVSVSALVLTGAAPVSAAVRIWGMWWLTHAMGILVVVPPALAFLKGDRRRTGPHAISISLSSLGLIGVLAAIAWIPFLSPPGSVPSQLFFLSMPFLLWVSVREGITGAALGGLVVTTAAISAAVLDHGPFMAGSQNQGLFLTWSFSSVSLVAALMAGALVVEREHLQAQVLHGQKLESPGVLAGGIAHDFNNLLAGIMGRADLLILDKNLDAEAVEDVDGIITAAGHASELCRQMLAYAGKGSLDMGPVDLAASVRGLEKLLAVSVSTEVDLALAVSEEPVTVEADETQFRQVLLNLVTNGSEAVMAGPGKGTVTVEVTRRRLDSAWFGRAFVRSGLPEGDYAVLTVTDEGTGIAPETLSRMFDPFFSSKGPSRGLGLAVTMGVIRGHGGSLVVDTEVGVGTSFQVAFPLVDVPEAPEDHPPPAEESGSPRTVLIVDDEPIVRSVLSRLVQAHGHQSVEARDGDEALEVLSRNGRGVDLVLLDLTMPGRGGISTVQEMRVRGLDTPVLIISGYSKESVPEDLDVVGFVQKPVRAAVLKEALEGALGAGAPGA